MATTYKTLHVDPKGDVYGRQYVWQLPVRLSHWVDALAITSLFFTGLYIADPILMPAGPAWKNFVMGYVREAHFIFAYIFLFGFIVRSYWFWTGNNYARSGFPMVWRPAWWKDLSQQAAEYAKTKPGPPHLGHNALAGLSYTLVVIALGGCQILTGFALYSEHNPGGFWDRAVGWIIPLIGSPQTTRTWHHMFAWMFVCFFLVHIYIVLFDGTWYRNGLISSMISGFKYYKDGDKDNTGWIS